MGAELRGGTYGATDVALEVAGGGRHISYSARVSRFSADGLYPFNNNYRNKVGVARIQVTPDARSDASLTYRYGDDIYHFPTDGTGAAVDSNQRSAERGPLLSLSAGRLLGQHLDVRVTAGVKEARQLYNNEPDSPGQDGFWSRDYVRRATTSALLNWRARGGASVSGGIEYEDERQHGRSEFSSVAFGTSPDSIDVQRNNTGYFTQAVVPAGRAAVTLGTRLDDNSQFGTHATYRGGVVYRLEGARLRLSVGTGFKEPTFFENFARGFVVGNPKLTPERSLSWELGVERGAITVTYFNQRFRDLIEYSPTPVGPDSVNYFNVGGAIANGIETSFSKNVGDRVTVSLNYTYLHTRVEESGSPSNPNGLFVPGKPLVRRPAHTLAPQVVAALGTRARLIVWARWVGKRDDVGGQRVTLRPDTRVNLAAEYAVGGLVLSSSVENAFNDQTQEINGFRPRGRTVMLGGRVTWGLFGL
jgi:vitamin B12 transporter